MRTTIGRREGRKKGFLRESYSWVECAPGKMLAGADLNGHVGEGNAGEKVTGKYGFSNRNADGEKTVILLVANAVYEEETAGDDKQEKPCTQVVHIL